jgi:hypothetical protein
MDSNNEIAAQCPECQAALKLNLRMISGFVDLFGSDERQAECPSCQATLNIKLTCTKAYSVNVTSHAAKKQA